MKIILEGQPLTMERIMHRLVTLHCTVTDDIEIAETTGVVCNLIEDIVVVSYIDNEACRRAAALTLGLSATSGHPPVVRAKINTAFTKTAAYTLEDARSLRTINSQILWASQNKEQARDELSKLASYIEEAAGV